MNGERERRWLWYTQVLHATAATAGFIILGVEVYRATYNAVGVTAALSLLAAAGLGELTKLLARRNGKS